MPWVRKRSATIARDIILLKQVGIQPVILNGGAPDW